MDQRILDLVQAATTQTQRGHVVWKAFDDETFRAPIGTGHLHIRREWARPDFEEDTPAIPTYTVEVSDAQGRVGVEERIVDGAEHYRLFEQLFRAARSSGVGTDRVIDQMLQVLKLDG